MAKMAHTSKTYIMQYIYLKRGNRKFIEKYCFGSSILSSITDIVSCGKKS